MTYSLNLPPSYELEKGEVETEVYFRLHLFSVTAVREKSQLFSIVG